MDQGNILLVEGERVGEASLAIALRKAGYAVTLVHTSGAALDYLQEGLVPHVVVFDAASMRTSGVRSCRQMRRLLADHPIILTYPAGAEPNTHAQANLYLAKPFTARKLLNRIRTLLPPDELKEEIVRAGDLTLFLNRRSVIVTGKEEVHLTPRLVRLLEEFVRHPNQLVTRKQIMHNVWQTKYLGDTRTLDVHIRWIREAIEPEPERPVRLITVRGRGYIFYPQPQGNRADQPG